jgi:HK97 family phage prohead protease
MVVPLPKPNPGESQKDFLNRCMGDEVMVSEFEDEAQRYAVCVDLWKEAGREMDERKALPVHHTAVSDAPWDGSRNEANLRNDGDAEYYRQAYAWVDPEKDPDTKAAYKFIHHNVSADGEVGAANIKACQTGIGVLNGARGGADIPEADREGVWKHLAAHLRDAELEPAPLRSLPVDDLGEMFGDYEVRSLPGSELRVMRKEGGGPGTLIGSPGIPYNSWSEDLGGFVERVLPGAVRYEGFDVVCCRDHEDHLVLGRLSNGTLRLSEGKKGLNYECDLPDVSYAHDLVKLVERGDVRGSSFRFTVLRDEWIPARGSSPARREIHELQLFELGPVTMPAYPQTVVGLRSLFQKLGIDADRLGVAVRRVRSGDPTGEDIDVITKTIASLRQLLPAPRQGAEGPIAEAQGRLELARKRLELLVDY